MPATMPVYRIAPRPTVRPGLCRPRQAEEPTHHRNADQLGGGQRQGVHAARPAVEQHDVQRVQGCPDEREGLPDTASADSCETQDGEAHDGEADRGPRMAVETGLEADPQDDRGQDHVGAGDESRDRCGGGLEADRLDDLGEPVEASQRQPDLPLLCGEPDQPSPEQDGGNQRRDGEPDGQEIDGVNLVNRVLDDEERRAPDRGDGEDRNG